MSWLVNGAEGKEERETNHIKRWAEQLTWGSNQSQEEKGL